MLKAIHVDVLIVNIDLKFQTFVNKFHPKQTRLANCMLVFLILK